jgi:ribosomal protein S18 acetylase RimI-like enzyme
MASADAEHSWALAATLEELHCRVRPLAAGDEARLTVFALRGLSARSRTLFAPYNWAAGAHSLATEFRQSIERSCSRQDLHLVALDSANAVVAHGFLWSMASDVPELGLAVADAWHGRGIGRAMLGLLEGAARAESKSAIELTTMQENTRALRTYTAAGYERLGLILNPLGVDVTAAFRGEDTCKPTGVVEEHHMVLILDDGRRETVLAELDAKRARADELFGTAKSEEAELSRQEARPTAAGSETCDGEQPAAGDGAAAKRQKVV